MSLVMLVVLALSLVAQEAIGQEQKLALQFTSSANVEAKLTYFEDYTRTEDDLALVVNTNVANMCQYLSNTMTDMLVGKKAGKISRMGSIVVTTTLGKKGYDFIRERKGVKKVSGTSPNYNIVMQAMFKRMLRGSAEIEAKLKATKAPKDPVALERRKNKLFTTIVEALKHKDNKVSIYFDWTTSTFNDLDGSEGPKNLEQEVTEVMGLARYYGFGNVMSSIETLLNLFFWWSGKGWE